MSEMANPLPVLPGHLIVQQQLTGLDALHSAFRRVAVDYARLQRGLLDEAPNGHDLSELAWSQVDTARRVEVLLTSTRGIKQKAQPVKRALLVLAEAEPLRHICQHPPGELQKEAGSLMGNIY